MHSPRIQDGNIIRRLTEEELCALAKRRGEGGADAGNPTIENGGGLADEAGDKKSPRENHLQRL